MLRMTRSAVGLSLVLVCLFCVPALASASDEIRACVNPAGKVRLVAPGSVCHQQEQLVVWNLQGPQGPQGEQGAEGPQGPEGPRGADGAAASVPRPAMVLDSNDKVVGHLMSRTGEILMRVADDVFTVTASRGGFMNTGRFIFLSQGCTDTPHGLGVNSRALAHMALVTPGVGWVPDLTANAVTVTPPPGEFAPLWVRSVDASGAVGSCQQSVTSSSVTMWPVKAVDLTGFASPFRVQ